MTTSDINRQLRALHGAALRDRRKAAGLSHAKLAARIRDLHVNASRQSVAQWESGECAPRPLAIAALARIYGVPYADIALDGLPEKVELPEPPSAGIAFVAEVDEHGLVVSDGAALRAEAIAREIEAIGQEVGGQNWIRLIDIARRVRGMR
jgi:transcriptional regulator with XRE-family HTH domain